MNLKKKVYIGLGLLISSIVVGLLLPFPYNLPMFIAGIIILISANSQWKNEKKERIGEKK